MISRGNATLVAVFPLLHTFVTVYEYGQFSAAAAELHVSQSTVSTRIASLEKQVGAQLFVRRARHDVQPTAAGDVLYQAAVKTLAAWQDTQSDIHRAQHARLALRLMASHTTAVSVLPAMLAAITDNTTAADDTVADETGADITGTNSTIPHGSVTAGNLLDRVDLTVTVANSDAIVNAVAAHEAHLGIIEKPTANDAITRVAVQDDDLVVAGTHASRPTSPDALWLRRESGSGVRYYTDMFFAHAGFTPLHCLDVASNAAICACLAQGVGTSVVSRSVVPRGVPFEPLGRDFTRRFYAICPRSGLGREERRIIDALIAAATS